ncbi:hypothetical protein BZA05DRAFT_409040 [Tricharina praecox]|uniref:uncharacterized protein n=1 Tax=Tricharina praecox TaxID=43433 RepID=UPI00221FFE96|nr:uncharacterized protein BZA05DRAFT_409040 [Tricharina praecox]KAI5844932.1 hypothetical protein BZA05DRAFT_409040 [Tricharina praecox]
MLFNSRILTFILLHSVLLAITAAPAPVPLPSPLPLTSTADKTGQLGTLKNCGDCTLAWRSGGQEHEWAAGMGCGGGGRLWR